MRTVYYASGRSDRIEVAVRRALMTSVSQITQKISGQNAVEFGADGWEISAHVGARPSHAVYQGRQYPNSQYETIVKPLIEDYNCRHSAYPIIMGVTKPAYTDEELAVLDPPPFTYEGKQYTAYKAQQQMRKMERAMRKQKDRCIVADAAGDKDAFTAASIKLRRQKDIYEDFCKAAGTYTEYERTFVAGYNRKLAAKTGAVTRAQNKFKNAQITLTNLGNGGISINNGKVIDLQEYTVNGVTYKADGKHVILDPSKREREIAVMISKKYGKTVKLVPRIVFPAGIQTPDYLIDDIAFDLKSPTGQGKNTLYGMISKKKKQSSNFIFDITLCPLSNEEIERQIETIYNSSHTEFVSTIVVIKDEAVIKVYKK